MAKNKEHEVFTEEEIKEKAFESYKVFASHGGFGEPTNSYRIGDRVRVGNLKNCVVEDTRIDNGLQLYCISHDEKQNNFNVRITSFNEQEIPVKREYTWAPWYKVRPYEMGKSGSHFTENKEVDIRFHNTTIESLLNKFYLSGVDMDPEYQRGYVWDDKDRESLLDSIFSHIEIGKFAFIKRDYAKEVLYEVLDGKQRLSALLDYFENRFPYKGVYFDELSDEDRYTFLETQVSIGEASEMSKKQIYEYFCKLNKSGKIMDESHLEKIREMANEEVGLFGNEDKEEDREI